MYRCVDCGTSLEPMEGAVSAADFECPKCSPESLETRREKVLRGKVPPETITEDADREAYQALTKSVAAGHFVALTDEQRLEIMREYCRYCGIPFKDCQGEVCHCENDE